MYFFKVEEEFKSNTIPFADNRENEKPADSVSLVSISSETESKDALKSRILSLESQVRVLLVGLIIDLSTKICSKYIYI